MDNILYLHGFASAPSSTKAQFFAQKLNEAGARVLLPDLNVPSFETLTLTSQLAIIDRYFHSGNPPQAIIGSSMGGLLATLCAAKYPSLKALVLLAPGYSLPRRWQFLLGEDKLQQWQESGFTEVFHHGINSNAKLHYGFIEDANRYATDNLRVDIPVLIFHGKNDQTVPADESIRFARNNSKHAELHLLDSDHGLLDCLELMWQRTCTFLSEQGLLSLASCL